MPITPDDAAQLSPEEDQFLTAMETALDEAIRATYSPHEPDWLLSLPVGSLLDVGFSYLNSPVDQRARVKYLQSFLVARYREKGWGLSFDYDRNVIEIRRLPSK